jgi:hypothetical protein
VTARARQVDDAAGDVDRVRAEPLVVPRDQGHLHRDGDRRLPGGELGHQAAVQFVQALVALGQDGGGAPVALVPGVRRLPPHLRSEISHPRDQALDARGEVVVDEVTGAGRDVHHQVVRALKLRHDTQDRQQEPQVGGHRGLQQYLPVGQALHLDVQGIDGAVTLGQRQVGLVVPGQQRLGGHGHALGDHREQLDDLALDGLKLVVELLPVLVHDRRVRPQGKASPNSTRRKGNELRGQDTGWPAPAGCATVT